MVMWSNCMRFVGEQGVAVGELEDLARTTTNLNGMERWGYIVVEPDPADSRPKPPRSAWVIRTTPKGRKAQALWRPLLGAIEERWQARFGNDEIDQLRESLWALISRPRAKVVSVPVCLCRCSSPASCWRSPSSSKASRTCRWRSAPTSCGCSMRKAYGSETFRS